MEFAHRCIDAGAHAVVGTGPHMLRPIEIYKGCPIFYSLGDFIIQLETVKKAPVGFFEKQGMTGSEGLDEMFEKRSDHGGRACITAASCLRRSSRTGRRRTDSSAS